MKGNFLYIAGAAAILALWWHNRQGLTALDQIPINAPPAQLAVLQSLLPTVDKNGNIVNPVNENFIAPYGG